MSCPMFLKIKFSFYSGTQYATHVSLVFCFSFRTPAGYCFVDFGDYTGSQKVMAKLNGLPIPGSNPVSI